MLDESKIGTKEQEFLKCETCGLMFDLQTLHEEEDGGIGFDYWCIEKTGKCYECGDNS